MRTRRLANIEQLRRAVDGLPVRTRRAMLDGIRSNEIIAGAYSNGNGVCPMLAAHRAGGRANFASFAGAWDRFAFAGSRIQVARRATTRELLILSTHLEASLLEEDGPAPDLAEAMAEHRDLMARREERPRPAPRQREPRRSRASRPAALPRPGDPDRSRELRTREGWAWMRVFRRYDDYERALARLHSEQAALSDESREPQLIG